MLPLLLEVKKSFVKEIWLKSLLNQRQKRTERRLGKIFWKSKPHSQDWKHLWLQVEPESLWWMVRDQTLNLCNLLSNSPARAVCCLSQESDDVTSSTRRPFSSAGKSSRFLSSTFERFTFSSALSRAATTSETSSDQCSCSSYSSCSWASSASWTTFSGSRTTTATFSCGTSSCCRWRSSSPSTASSWTCSRRIFRWMKTADVIMK